MTLRSLSHYVSKLRQDYNVGELGRAGNTEARQAGQWELMSSVSISVIPGRNAPKRPEGRTGVGEKVQFLQSHRRGVGVVRALTGKQSLVKSVALSKACRD